MSDDYAQPHVTYNRITGSTVQKGDHKFHVVIRKWHTDTGAERFETSTLFWPTEAEAQRAANVVVARMSERIAGHG